MKSDDKIYANACLLPLADKAYRDMRALKESQSIIVSGKYRKSCS